LPSLLQLYRHKDVYYNRRGSYPDGLGIKTLYESKISAYECGYSAIRKQNRTDFQIQFYVLYEIPRNVTNVSKEKFEEWVRKDSRICVTYVEMLIDPDDSTKYVLDKQRDDVFIEWIYEINLCQLAIPISLGQHATRRHFHFGHCALYERTPVQIGAHHRDRHHPFPSH
jgi:hypothetical protein